jgi:hypothetical protein
VPAAPGRDKRTPEMPYDPNPGNTDPVYAFNLDQATTPAGMKVRWKIRVATGPEAQRLDIIQQQAIINLLTWADTHLNNHTQNSGKTTEIPARNSPDTITNSR